MNEMKIIYEYTKQENTKILKQKDFHQVLDISQIPTNFTPIYSEGDKSIILGYKIDRWFSETKFNYPRLDNYDTELRESTMEELKVEGLYGLEEGEIIVASKLIKLEKPSSYHVWDKNEWKFEYNLVVAKKEEIDRKAYDEIVEKYPIWRQNNIQADFLLRDKREEFEKMNMFILEIRAQSDNEWYDVQEEVKRYEKL